MHRAQDNAFSLEIRTKTILMSSFFIQLDLKVRFAPGRTIMRIFVIPSGVIGRDGMRKVSAELVSSPNRKLRERLSWDLRTFILLSIVMAVPANALMLLLPFDSSVDNYVDSTSVEMLFFATLILLLVIPRVKDKSFKTTAILIAFGFMFQLIASGIWYYYGNIAEPRGVPRVNVGDLLHLGSYVLWMIAAVPYAARYRRLMSGRSMSFLIMFIALVTTVSLISFNFWYNSSALPGFDVLVAASQLSYILVPAIFLVLPLLAALIYATDGYGRGLKKYYWVYSIIPMCLIAASDILRSTYFSIYQTGTPFRLDDVLALTGYATAISAALRLLKSQISSVDSVPLVLEGEATTVRIELRSGKGYVVEDPRSEFGFEMFRQLITAACTGQQQRGFIISRLDAIEIFQKYGCKDMRFVQIGPDADEKAKNQETTLSIAQSILEYLQGTKSGVVLLDGIDLLIAEYGFKNVIRLLEQIGDFASQYNSYLIMPADPEVLSGKEKARIERTFETIRIGRAAALG